MKNYRKSDYAINKYSSGIVYRFVNQIIEIMLEDYLEENPGKTEQDFHELKALSDSMYLQQIKDENAQTKKNIPLIGNENRHELTTLPLETIYFELWGEKNALNAAERFIQSGILTETQERRFRMYFNNGMTMREIAQKERVSHVAIRKSILFCIKKLNNFIMEG